MDGRTKGRTDIKWSFDQNSKFHQLLQLAFAIANQPFRINHYLVNKSRKSKRRRPKFIGMEENLAFR